MQICVARHSLRENERYERGERRGQMLWKGDICRCGKLGWGDRSMDERQTLSVKIATGTHRVSVSAVIAHSRCGDRFG